MIVSDITKRIRVILNDLEGVRWINSELIRWIDDAQKIVAQVRPDSSVATGVLACAEGTKQSLSSFTNAFRVLDVMRNMTAGQTVNGVTPYTPGRSVRLVDREVFDSQDPDWHKKTGSATITNWIYDNRNPRTFYVYPPATTAAHLEVIYSKIPEALIDVGDNQDTLLAQSLTIPDIYLDVIVNYVLFRAYSKDAEYANNAQLAASYLQVFNGMLGLATQKDAAYSPDLNSKGSSPNAAALQAGGV